MSSCAKKFYAVASGRTTGVFASWNECQVQVQGYRGAIFKSFATVVEAEAFIGKFAASGSTSAVNYGTTVRGKLFNTPSFATRSSGAKSAAPIKAGGVPANEKKRRREPRNRAADSKSPAPPAKRRRFALDASEYASCKNVTHIYTDGSFKKRFGGAGVFFGHGDKRNIAEPLPGELQTSCRAELYAIIRALETILSSYEEDVEACDTATVIIHSDSEYAIGTAKGDWRRNLNLDLLDKIDTLVAACHRHRILYDQVPAHSNIEGNEQADQLANAGADKNRAIHEKFDLK